MDKNKESYLILPFCSCLLHKEIIDYFKIKIIHFIKLRPKSFNKYFWGTYNVLGLGESALIKKIKIKKNQKSRKG